MYLNKETFERAGLPGKPHGPKGNRGLKPRWSKTFSHDKSERDIILSFTC